MISHCMQLVVSPFVMFNLFELEKLLKKIQKYKTKKLLRKAEWSSTQKCDKKAHE